MQMLVFHSKRSVLTFPGLQGVCARRMALGSVPDSDAAPPEPVGKITVGGVTVG